MSHLSLRFDGKTGVTLEWPNGKVIIPLDGVPTDATIDLSPPMMDEEVKRGKERLQALAEGKKGDLAHPWEGADFDEVLAGMPAITEEEISSPLFEALWMEIKTWDVAIPHRYRGYCGANGSHVKLLLEAIEPHITLLHKQLNRAESRAAKPAPPKEEAGFYRSWLWLVGTFMDEWHGPIDYAQGMAALHIATQRIGHKTPLPASLYKALNMVIPPNAIKDLEPVNASNPEPPPGPPIRNIVKRFARSINWLQSVELTKRQGEEIEAHLAGIVQLRTRKPEPLKVNAELFLGPEKWDELLLKGCHVFMAYDGLIRVGDALPAPRWHTAKGEEVTTHEHLGILNTEGLVDSMKERGLIQDGYGGGLYVAPYGYECIHRGRIVSINELLPARDPKAEKYLFEFEAKKDRAFKIVEAHEPLKPVPAQGLILGYYQTGDETVLTREEQDLLRSPGVLQGLLNEGRLMEHGDGSITLISPIPKGEPAPEGGATAQTPEEEATLKQKVEEVLHIFDKRGAIWKETPEGKWRHYVQSKGGATVTLIFGEAELLDTPGLLEYMEKAGYLAREGDGGLSYFLTPEGEAALKPEPVQNALQDARNETLNEVLWLIESKGGAMWRGLDKRWYYNHPSGRDGDDVALPASPEECHLLDTTGLLDTIAEEGYLTKEEPSVYSITQLGKEVGFNHLKLLKPKGA